MGSQTDKHTYNNPSTLAKNQSSPTTRFLLTLANTTSPAVIAIPSHIAFDAARTDCASGNRARIARSIFGSASTSLMSRVPIHVFSRISWRCCAVSSSMIPRSNCVKFCRPTIKRVIFLCRRSKVHKPVMTGKCIRMEFVARKHACVYHVSLLATYWITSHEKCVRLRIHVP